MTDYDFERGIARENLCRFLAACYYQPGPEFAEERLFESMLDAARRIDPDLAAHARRLGGEFAAEGLENLLLDYTRLFLGPNQVLAKPYGSVWLSAERALVDESTMAVQKLYAEGGFEIDEEFRELPDHVAAELEFLYLLIYRENQARRESEQEALRATLALRKRFLGEHLGRWIEPFTAQVKAGARSGFYRELGELTARFVGMEVAAGTAG